MRTDRASPGAGLDVDLGADLNAQDDEGLGWSTQADAREAVAITLRGMASPTVAGLADSATDPPALRDSLTHVARRLLAGGLAAEVVES